MKKTIFLLFLLFFNVLQANASNVCEYCSTNTAQKTLKGSIFSICGINFLSKKIIEKEISHLIKKETNSKVKIKIDNFFGVDILSGQFSSLNAKSKNFAYGGLYFSDLNIKTVCPYNYISFSQNKLNFKENMFLEYETNITQNDLEKISNSPEFKNIIEEMNKNNSISSLIEIKNINLALRKNKLYLKYTILPASKNNIITSFIKPIKISLGANLTVENEKLKLSNINTPKKYSFLNPIINKLDPLLYGFEIKIKQAQINDNKILITGTIFIPKN